MNRIGWTLLVVVGAGCATNGTPAELADARATYARAAASTAAQSRPTQLREARWALDRAERARSSGVSREELRVYSYVAKRKAETAEALGRALLAAERRNRADEKLHALQQRRSADSLAARVGEGAPTEAPDAAAANSAEAQVSEGGPVAAAPAGSSVSVERVTPPEPAPSSAPVPAQPEAPALASAAPAPGQTAAGVRERLLQVGSVREESRGLLVSIPVAALFEPGTATLMPEVGGALDAVAAAVSASSSGEPVTIEAHGAGGGARDAALFLAQQRAEAVRSYVLARGADPGRVLARGVGTDRPNAATVATGGGGDAGERIEILLPGVR